MGDYFGDLQGAVWAVGAAGSIWRWTRSTNSFEKFEDVPTEVLSRNLRSVAALSPTDVWVVGDAGTILHFDGSNWQLVDSPTLNDLNSIDFAPNRSIGYAVGKSGTIIRFTPFASNSSGEWRVEASPTTKDLTTVWVGATEMWAGGVAGCMLNKLPTSSNQNWKLRKSLTNETLLSFEGVRTDYASACIGTNGLKLMNRYGTWIIDRYLDFEMRAFVLNPTYSKQGYAVGVGGMGSTMVYDLGPIVPFATGTNVTLNAITMLEENVVFAFGNNGTCVKGSSNINHAWKPCELPGPNDVYGATALMEGPLRLPFPRPSASVQVLSNSSSSEEWLDVQQFPLVLRAMNYRLSGEDVFMIDFSTIQATGVYRIYVDGLGASYSFVISPSALDLATYHSCRMLYYQRSGMPQGLEAPYAEDRYVRPQDHEFNTSVGGRRIDGAYHWSIAESPLYDGEEVCPLNLPGSCPEESYRDGAGGWFDAGDYSKYISTGTATV